MKFPAFQTLRELFSSIGHGSGTSEQGPSDYTPCEIDSLRCEARENNALAVQVATARGYRRNPRALQLG